VGLIVANREGQSQTGGEVRLYTKTGDQGRTSLWHGGRVPKDDPVIEANGAIDELQAAIGMARAKAPKGSAIQKVLEELGRDCWILMAEVATPPEHRGSLVGASGVVTKEMVSTLEGHIDDVMSSVVLPASFVVPGTNELSATLDLARAIARRAERRMMPLLKTGWIGGQKAKEESPLAFVWINRLSDLLWALARAAEGK
jgi:cob(I)alamin adenosyltransferase